MIEKLWRFLQKLGVFGVNAVYYIGGSDVLPPPLKGQEEQNTLIALENGDEGAKQKLIEHNLRLVVFIARRFENTGVNCRLFYPLCQIIYFSICRHHMLSVHWIDLLNSLKHSIECFLLSLRCDTVIEVFQEM